MPTPVVHTITLLTALSSTGIPSSTHWTTLHNGNVLVDRTLTPFLCSARALRAKGLKGKLVMVDQRRSYPRMIGIIEAAADLDVFEDTHLGPVLTRFRKQDPYSR